MKKLLVLWVCALALKVSRGEDQQTGRRSTCKEGYSYSPIVGSCYKIPHVTLDWNGAYEYCEKEGTHLAVVNSETEHQELKAKMQRDGWTSGSTNPSYYLIGFKADNNRVFKTIFNESLDEAGYSDWADTEPNNVSGNENCGSLFENDGKLNDIVCSTQAFAFICEQDILPLPRPDVKKCLEGYTYSASVGSCYKIPHVTLPWDGAYNYCQNEGAHLAVVNSETEHRELKAKMNKDGWTQGSWHPGYYYIGFRADASRVFRTIFNETLEEAGYNEWSATEPNNLNNDEYCGSLFSIDGKLNDMKCAEYSFAFICEQDNPESIHVNEPTEALKVSRGEDQQTGRRSTCKEGYSYSPIVGSCYKIPHVTLDWNAAYEYCEKEGTHLAVVNSETEHQELKAKMQRDGWTSGSTNPSYYLIGFKADNNRVFKTIFNESLDEAGYSDWADTEPNNLSGNENCGSLFENDGKLNDIVCSTQAFAFICEQDILPRPRPDVKKCLEGYTYSASVGSCYKIPHVTLPWDGAYKYCQNEGAHLAVVNSETEHRELKAKMNKDGWTQGSWHPGYYYIGFRADASRVFRTIFNETLEEAGYNEWSATEPNNLNNDEYCGSLFSIDGKLNDMKCTEYSFAFICEQDNPEPIHVNEPTEVPTTTSPSLVPNPNTGYEYIGATNTWYKVHEENMNPDRILQTCKDEAATHLSIQDGIARHVHAVFQKYRHLRSLCIWDNDIKTGVTFLRSGVRILDLETCSNFVCIKSPNGQGHNTPGSAVDRAVAKYYRKDYSYDETTDIFYKVHMTKGLSSDRQIYKICRSEGAVVLTDQREDSLLLDALRLQNRNLGSVCIEDSGYGSDWWIISNSAIKQATNCNTDIHSFICKVKPSGKHHDSRCGKYGAGYKFFASVGRCYDIPTLTLSWDDALEFCKAQDAHLAIPNSRREKKVLYTMMNRYGWNPNAWNHLYYHIGFKADENRRFATIFNQSLEETGYNVWSTGEPNNMDEEEYCGSLFIEDATLSDVKCFDAYGFICEKDVDLNPGKGATTGVKYDFLVPEDNDEYTITTDSTNVQQGNTVIPSYPFLPGYQTPAIYLLPPYTLPPGSLTSGAANGLSKPEQPNLSLPLPIYVIAYTLPNVNTSCPCYFLKPNQTNASKPQPMPAQPTPYGIIGYAPVIFMPNCQESSAINNKKTELPKAPVVHYNCNKCQANGQHRQRRSASLVHEITTLEELDDLLKKHIKPAREDMGNIGANVNIW